MRKLKTHRFTGFIRLTSGTRIGGASESVGIGAIDLTYVRNPVDGKPYLPGSSLKGRLRTVLEERVGRAPRTEGSPCGCGGGTCFVCRLFGPHFNLGHKLGPSRLTVHDAAFVQGPDAADPLSMEPEIKAESVNNRDTGSAQHPRFQERVPPGCLFRFVLMVDVWGTEPSEEEPGSSPYGNEDRGWSFIRQFLLDGLSLLQSAGIGSRVRTGSGQFEFLAGLGDKQHTITLDGETVDLPALEQAEARLATVQPPQSMEGGVQAGQRGNAPRPGNNPTRKR